MRVPKIHELKVELRYWPSIKDGSKTFELRKDDRDFQVGDFLLLRAFDGEVVASEQRVIVKITYTLRNVSHFGLDFGYVILGLKSWERLHDDEKMMFVFVDRGAINEDALVDKRHDALFKNVDVELPKDIGRYWCIVEELTETGTSRYQWNCSYNPSDPSPWTDNGKPVKVTWWTDLAPNPY